MKWLWPVPAIILLAGAAAPVRAAPALHLKAPAHLEAELLDAFHLQLPEVEPLTTAAASADDRVVVVSLDGSRLLLTVQRATGEVLLSRTLEPGPALASTCALVVDRFLTETHWTPAAATDAPVVGEARPSEPAPAASSYVLGLGASYAHGLDRDLAGAGPEVALWARRSGWLIGVRGGLRFIGDREIVATDPLLGPATLGTLSAGAASLDASAGPCVGERMFGCASVVAGGIVTWARSTGVDLYRQQSVASVQPTTGLSLLGGIGRLPWDLQAHGEVIGRLRFGSSRVEVEGVGDVMRAPRFELAVTLGVGRALQ